MKRVALLSNGSPAWNSHDRAGGLPIPKIGQRFQDPTSLNRKSAGNDQAPSDK
jgi:hypothetical protein